MNTKGSTIVLFLCFLGLFTLTDCSTCDKSIVEGGTLSFKLTDGSLNDERFEIKKDGKRFVPKTNKINHKEPGTVKGNNWEFQPVNQIHAGSYTVEVFNKDGKNIKQSTETVCVYVKIPKPRVNVTCVGMEVSMTCEVEESKDLSYSWLKNKKDFQKKDKVIQTVKKDNSKYACTVQNPANKQTSDEVEVTCLKSKQTLFGFDFTLMVSILAGGGALVLALIILLVCLACRSCRRKRKRQQDEYELRLNYVNASSPSHKGKNTARGQPAPPVPIDGSSEDLSQSLNQTASRPRAQQRSRPPPPPLDDGEEQPPPLPQPRKKSQPKKV